MSARAAVFATLAAVPDIGIVYQYERFATAIDRLRAFYYSPTHAQLRGWFIRRVQIADVSVVKPRRTVMERFQLRGFMALDDDAGSELLMQALVDAIRDTFRADPTLGGTISKQGALSPGAEQGVRLDDFGPVMFGGVLCHGVRLSLTTYTETTV
jgi:hypothetical protein